MKDLFSFFLIGLFLLHIPSLLSSQSIDENRQYFFDHYEKKEVYINMRDGVRLFTSIYSPKDQSQVYPILMTRTPYSCSPYGEEKYRERYPDRYFHLVKEGFIFVVQDVRGCYMSEGTFVDVRPINPNKISQNDTDESTDTYDTVDWLTKNVTNSNGRVGIFGISYPGFYSTVSLPGAHEALKAVSPQAPVTDWFVGDDFHHNGAFFLMDAFSFFSGFGRPRPMPTKDRSGRMELSVQDNYQLFMDIGPIKNVKDKYFGDSIAFWDDLMAHPNYDAWWQARNPRPHLKNITPAVMTVGGWFDAEDSFGPLRVYEAIEKQNSQAVENRLVMGPWYHGQWARGDGNRMGNVFWGFNTTDYYKNQIELPFFNFYLKGKGNLNIAEASIFITGENAWKDFDEWPPEEAQEKALYLHADGGLSFRPPTGSASFDEYISDPSKPVPYTEDVHLRRTREYMTDDQRFAARRPDVMVYQTNILEEEVSITGPLNVEFYVSTTGTDADYVVKLIDVFPDKLENYPANEKAVPMGGYQMMVRGDILRGRFRDDFSNPTPFNSGEVTKVSFELPDIAHSFKKGHKIMIQVQNSWFPLVDINPQKFVDIYSCDETDFQKATHRIYHEAKFPSHLKVLILK